MKISVIMQFSVAIFFTAVISWERLSVSALPSTSEEDDDDEEVEVIDIDEEMGAFDLLTYNHHSQPPPPVPTVPPPPPASPPSNDRMAVGSSSNDDIITNNTRCSQTHLSFTKETLLHVWEIKGLIGYISYIKRFEQPFEVKTDHVSFKSDNVDGKWIFEVHKVRHHSPFSIHSSSSPSATTASASSASYANPNSHNDIGDIRIVATYSYEAKQPRNIDFILSPTIIHGSKEIALPPKKSTSPTIVQQKFYNTRGYQLNSNFLEYVYTFTWTNVIHPLNNIKNSLIHRKFHLENEVIDEHVKPEIPQKQQPTYYLHGSDNVGDASGSDELFEEITKTDFSGHFGDVTVKFVISAFFPEEPVSFTSSRCNASVLDLVSHNLLEKLTMTTKHSLAPPNSSSKYFRKDVKHQGFIGHGIPPYLRYSYSMLHDDRFADVALVVGQEELLAHRIILATSSPVFSAILENATVFGHPLPPLNEDQSNCEQARSQQRLLRILIEPQNIGIDSVQELLRYIYTGTVDNSRMKAVSHRLIIIAAKYGLPELKRYCEGFLLQSLTVDNAIEMYLLGARVSSEKITRKAMIVMKLNKGKVATQTEEFRELSMRHPTLMYDLFLSD